jgi:2'-5' RNA ligase
MHGVVSLLDDTHYALVENLWAEISRELGLKDFYKTPFPHFSYHVATHYDLTMLSLALKRLAANQPPFKVRTAGLGLFSGPQPVLYLALTRTSALSAFQQLVWQEVAPTASNGVGYYHPEQWMPHITLADGEGFKAHLPDVIRFLGYRSFQWEITLNNLALIYDNGATQEVGLQVPFS